MKWIFELYENGTLSNWGLKLSKSLMKSKLKFLIVFLPRTGIFWHFLYILKHIWDHSRDYCRILTSNGPILLRLGQYSCSNFDRLLWTKRIFTWRSLVAFVCISTYSTETDWVVTAKATINAISVTRTAVDAIDFISFIMVPML